MATVAPQSKQIRDNHKNLNGLARTISDARNPYFLEACSSLVTNFSDERLYYPEILPDLVVLVEVGVTALCSRPPEQNLDLIPTFGKFVQALVKHFFYFKYVDEALAKRLMRACVKWDRHVVAAYPLSPVEQ